jgi:hypothetical protein
MKTSIAAFLALLVWSGSIFSQEALKEKLNKDGVKVSYEWKPSDKKVADSPLQLCIVIDNTNEHFVKMEFTVEFYLKGEIYEESLAQKFCIKPGKQLKGKKYGLCWVSEEVSNEEINGSDFKWELGELKLEKIDSCE